MRELHEYIVTEDRTPTEDELLTLLDKAIQNNWVIKITWNERYHWRDMYITPENTTEEMANQAKELARLCEMGKHLYEQYFGV